MYEQVHLRDLRLAHGLTQQQVADHLGIHRQYYSQYELRNRKPSKEVMQQLADLFKVDLVSIVMYYYNK